MRILATLLIIGLIVHRSYGNCVLNGVNDNTVHITGTTATDTQREPFRIFDTENVLLVSLESTETTGYPYMDVYYDTDAQTLTFSPKAAFETFEEVWPSDETAPTLTLSVQLQCQNGIKRSVSLHVVIIDTNNHDPVFSNSNYEYKIPMPFPASIDITQFGDSIIVTDIDITNTRVEFSITPDDFFIEYDGPLPGSNNTKHQALLKAREPLRFVESQLYEMAVTDVGDPQRSTTATIKINIDEEASVAESPVFEDAFTIDEYISDEVDQFSTVVRLSTGLNAGVFLSGTYSEYFKATNNEDGTVAVELLSQSLPLDSIPAPFIVLTLIATLDNAEADAKMAIIITLPVDEDITTTTECPTVTTPTDCPTTTVCPLDCTECPTDSPSTPTDCPTTPTDCQTTPTDCPTTPTDCSTTTVCPLDCTECPTDSPSTPTDCPTTPTDCSTTTVCPLDCTECPTDCPSTPTECPTTPTDCQTTPTDCPTTPTDCSTTTVCPLDCTECPTDSPSTPTDCPTTPTDCSTTTVCPLDCTECPTDCPSTPTDCPTTPTDCQTTPTDCPTTPTDYSTTTVCPLDCTECPTDCPSTPTDCPTTPTDCQTTPTDCPTTPIDCSTTTVCPLDCTECPTDSPSTPTDCPTTPTDCQTTPTDCPTTPTDCSTTTVCPLDCTECPTDSTTTECPTTPIDCATTPIDCPTTPTDCPTTTECVVDCTECPTGSTPTECNCPTTPAPGELGMVAHDSLLVRNVLEGQDKPEILIPFIDYKDSNGHFEIERVVPNTDRICVDDDGNVVAFNLDRESSDFDGLNAQYTATVTLKKGESTTSTCPSRFSPLQETLTNTKAVSEGQCLILEDISNEGDKIVVAIIVEDANDHAPNFEPNTILIGYPEKNVLSLVSPPYIMQAQATDDDIGINAELAYEIVGTDKVVIHSETGYVYPTDDLYDSGDLTFQVRATDQNGAGLTSNTLSVTVKFVKQQHLSVIAYKNQDLEYVDDILSRLSIQAGSNINLKYLTASVLPTNDFTRSARDGNGNYLVIIAYAIKENSLMTTEELQQLLPDVDDLDISALPNTSGGGNNNTDDDDDDDSSAGLIAAVIVLAILLAIGIIGFIALYLLKFRKIENYSEMEEDGLSKSQTLDNTTPPQFVKNKNLAASKVDVDVQMRRPTGIVLSSMLSDDDLTPTAPEGEINDQLRDRRKSVAFNAEIEEISIETDAENEVEQDSEKKEPNANEKPAEKPEIIKV